MLKIGVGLFVYNRPTHTQQVLESLKQNKLSKIYIFCDAARDSNVSLEIKQVREIVKSIDWCEVEIVVHPHNLGTVKNIVFGVDHILKNNDAVIVLEDDCLVRPDFYHFMSHGLDFYKDTQEIFQVNGYQLPINLKKSTDWDVYFSAGGMSWGFGLWKRSWQYFRLDIDDAREYLASENARRVLQVIPNFGQRLRSQLRNEVDSFTYRWNFIINKHGGWVVCPYLSFVNNIGCDGQGVHFRKTRRFDIKKDVWQRSIKDASSNFRLPKVIIQDEYMDYQTSKFFPKRPELLLRIYKFLKGQLFKNKII